MYGGYRRHGFRFGWAPFAFGLLFLVLLTSGGFHWIWFLAWRLFLLVPLFLIGGAVFFGAMRWFHGGWGRHPMCGHHYHAEESGPWHHSQPQSSEGEKPKRTSNSDGDTIYYV